jgi:hypothetical protein
VGWLNVENEWCALLIHSIDSFDSRRREKMTSAGLTYQYIEKGGLFVSPLVFCMIRRKIFLREFAGTESLSIVGLVAVVERFQTIIRILGPTGLIGPWFRKCLALIYFFVEFVVEGVGIHASIFQSGTGLGSFTVS